MADNEKRFMGYAVAAPIIIAVLLTVIFCIVVEKTEYPYENGAYFAEYNDDEIKEPLEFSPENESAIKKSELKKAADENTLIGEIAVGNTSYPLIYNGNEVNASGKFNITGDTLIGEVGVCFAEIYKNDSNMLRLLSKGETITATTFYSLYEYEVVESFVAENESELLHAGEGMGRVLVLYTDNNMGVGIGSDYFVCVCKMTSGTEIAGG